MSWVQSMPKAWNEQCMLALQEEVSLCTTISCCVNSSINNGLVHLLVAGSGLDLTQLCVTTGKICWLLYVDALVLNMNGNVLDALSIAARVGRHIPTPCKPVG